MNEDAVHCYFSLHGPEGTTLRVYQIMDVYVHGNVQAHAHAYILAYGRANIVPLESILSSSVPLENCKLSISHRGRIDIFTTHKKRHEYGR